MCISNYASLDILVKMRGCESSSIDWNSSTAYIDLGSFWYRDFLLGHLQECLTGAFTGMLEIFVACFLSLISLSEHHLMVFVCLLQNLYRKRIREIFTFSFVC